MAHASLPVTCLPLKDVGISIENDDPIAAAHCCNSFVIDYLEFLCFKIQVYAEKGEIVVVESVTEAVRLCSGEIAIENCDLIEFTLFNHPSDWICVYVVDGGLSGEDDTRVRAGERQSSGWRGGRQGDTPSVQPERGVSLRHSYTAP